MFKPVTQLMAALALTIAAAAPAQAYIIDFSSSGASTGIDPLGNSWTWQGGGWGSPGITAGSSAFGGAAPVNHFEIHFTGGTVVLAGDTRMSIAPLGSHLWTVTSLDASSVAFDAEASDPFLDPGQAFFVNVTMSTGNEPLAFTARWSDGEKSVPVPASVTLLGAGLAGLMASRRRKTV